MAGKFRDALTALAALTVSGVTHNYNVHLVPPKLDRAQLPSLLVAPTLDDSRQRKYGDFQLITPSGSAATVQYRVTHLLLYAPIGSARSPITPINGLIDVIDNYALAIRANPRLDETLYLPTTYAVFIAPVQYGGLLYHACRFWHTLTIET